MRQVQKLGKFAHPGQPNGVQRAVSLFGDDDFRDVFVLGVLVVIVLAVDKHDHVGVLLDGARITNVRKDGAVVP